VRAIDLLKLFGLSQKLVNRTWHLPIIDVDGISQVQNFNERDGMERLDPHSQLSYKYVGKHHSIFSKSTNGIGRTLIKPNVHRFLEFYAHNLLEFGHTGHFQELLFETAHQP
jgi:hypothetical protein